LTLPEHWSDQRAAKRQDPSTETARMVYIVNRNGDDRRRERPKRARPAIRLHQGMIRLGSRDPALFGWALARIRYHRKQSPAEQATGLGISLERLAALGLCRVPRPERRAEDLAAVARHIGVSVEFLAWLLRVTTVPEMVHPGRSPVADPDCHPDRA
jgi:hypothetical protein